MRSTQGGGQEGEKHTARRRRGTKKNGRRTNVGDESVCAKMWKRR